MVYNYLFIYVIGFNSKFMPCLHVGVNALSVSKTLKTDSDLIYSQRIINFFISTHPGFLLGGSINSSGT